MAIDLHMKLLEAAKIEWQVYTVEIDIGDLRQQGDS